MIVMWFFYVLFFAGFEILIDEIRPFVKIIYISAAFWCMVKFIPVSPNMD